ERSLLLRALHEHRDRRPDALIDEHHETFSSLPRKTAQPPPVAAMARTCTSTTGLLILQVSSLAFPPRSELLSMGDQVPNPSSKIRSARVSGHRSKGMRVRPPNSHSRMSDRRLAQSIVGNPD